MNPKSKISLGLLAISLACNSNMLFGNTIVEEIEEISEVGMNKMIDGTTTSSNAEQIIELSNDSYQFYAGGGPKQEASITTMYNVKFSIVANEIITIKVGDLSNYINKNAVNITVVFRDESGKAVVTKNVKSIDKQVTAKFDKGGIYTLEVINNMNVPVKYDFTLD